MKNILLLIFAVSIIACSEKPVKVLQEEGVKEELPLFKIYGELMPDGYIDGANPITETYGFRQERVTGCEVGSALLKEVQAHNKTALKAMNKKYGENWQKEFEEKTGYKLAIPFD